MSRQINFLAERRKGITKQQIQDLRVMKIASAVLGLACLVGVVVFGVFFYFTYRFSQLKTQENILRSQIIGNQAEEEAQVVYSKKLSALASIYKDRKDKNQILNYFSTLFGADAILTGVDFDQKDRLLHFRVQAPDVFRLRRVLNLANSAEVKAAFPTLSMSELLRGDVATYELTITVPLKNI